MSDKIIRSVGVNAFNGRWMAYAARASLPGLMIARTTNHETREAALAALDYELLHTVPDPEVEARIAAFLATIPDELLEDED